MENILKNVLRRFFFVMRKFIRSLKPHHYAILRKLGKELLFVFVLVAIVLFIFFSFDYAYNYLKNLLKEFLNKFKRY